MKTRRTLPPTLLIVSVIVAFSLTMGMLAIVVWGITAGRSSPSRVVSGSTLSPRQIDQINRCIDLRPGEAIEIFYAPSITGNKNASVVTDRRVVGYSTDKNVKAVEQAEFSEIASADFVRSLRWSEDSTITIRRHDDTTLVLYASIDGDGDIRMMQAIQDAIELANE